MLEDVESLPQAWCSTSDDKGYGCATSHICDMDFQNPYNGQASFDNIGSSALIVIGDLVLILCFGVLRFGG